MHRPLHQVGDGTVGLSTPEERRNRAESAKRVLSIDRIDARGRRRRLAGATIVHCRGLRRPAFLGGLRVWFSLAPAFEDGTNDVVPLLEAFPDLDQARRITAESLIDDTIQSLPFVQSRPEIAGEPFVERARRREDRFVELLPANLPFGDCAIACLRVL